VTLQVAFEVINLEAMDGEGDATGLETTFIDYLIVLET